MLSSVSPAVGVQTGGGLTGRQGGAPGPGAGGEKPDPATPVAPTGRARCRLMSSPHFSHFPNLFAACKLLPFKLYDTKPEELYFMKLLVKEVKTNPTRGGA